MRIIGHIEHPNLKITLFKMDNKLSVKFEHGLLEQTYKFREGAVINGVEDLKKLVTPSFIEKVEDILKQMQDHKTSHLKAMEQAALDEFDEII